MPPERTTLEIVPMTITGAKAFIAQYHRHHKPPQGALFALGLSEAGELVGVATVGRPVARMLADGFTAEITRLCVREGVQNGCSKVAASAWRAARELGYRRMLTYTLPEEGGYSLRGAGWRFVGEAGGGSWSRSDRPREDKAPLGVKYRWEVSA